MGNEALPEDALDSCHARLAEALHDHGQGITLRRGQMLFHQGDAADAVFLLREGRLEVSVLSDTGRRAALNIINPGQLFGELSLIEGTTRSASISALEDSNLLRISRKALFEVIETTPAVAVALLQVVIGRARWISEQLEGLNFEPLDVRLARRLLYLRHMLAGDAPEVGISQQALGDHIGATREAVAKTLAQWKRDGLIETYRGGIRILRPEDLAVLAGAAPT